MYVILGATGNIGSVIAAKLLERGEKVRVLGRNPAKLEKLSKRGAEVFAADTKDETALTAALSGARAAFLMVPPNLTCADYRTEQDEMSSAVAAAVEGAGLRYAVNLTSIGAHAPSGAGPITGQRRSQLKLDKIAALNVLHLRPAYFMENELMQIGTIKKMGVLASAYDPDVAIPMIATRDIGNYAAERLLKLDFSGKQTRELLGQRDLSLSEVASIIGKAIGKPDLKYVQLPYDQMQQVLQQMGVPAPTATYFIEMFRGFNEGIVVNQEPRSAENTTPTSHEVFVQEVFVPAFKGHAASA
jgi:uncharacterized protein YbjT (DUF2867 family)